MKSLFAGAVEAQRNWHRCWTRAAGARSQPCFWTSVHVNHCMKEGLLRTSNKLAINSHGVTLHLSQVSYALMMFIWKSQVSHYWVVLTAVKLSWWYQITRYSCLETGFTASCYPVLPSSYIWAENGKESLQACLKSYNLIFYLLKWANDLSNLDRHRTRRDGLQQLLSTAKYLLGLKTQGENAKVQLWWMEGDIQKVLETVFNADIHNRVSTVASLWTYRMKKTLAPVRISHFCKPKAFVGIRAELTNLLTLQLGICGSTGLILPFVAAVCYFMIAWFWIAFHFKEWFIIFSLLLLQTLEYSS